LAPELDKKFDEIIYRIKCIEPSLDVPVNRVILLTRLATLLKDKGKYKEVEKIINKVITIIDSLEDVTDKCRRWSDLLPCLTSTESEKYNKKIIKHMEIQYLTDLQYKDDVIGLSQAIVSGKLFLSAKLRMVTGNDVEGEINNVIKLAEKITHPYDHMQLMVGLAKYIPEGYKDFFSEHCFEKAQRILPSGNNRTYSMMNLAKNLRTKNLISIIREALQNGRVIDDNYSRAMVMINLLTYLPEQARENELKATLKVINSIVFFLHKGDSFIDLAPLLPIKERENAYKLGISLVRLTAKIHSRCCGFSNIMKRLPSEIGDGFFEEAFNQVFMSETLSKQKMGFFNPHGMAFFAKNTVAYWRLEHLEKALFIARTSTDEDDKSILMAELMPIVTRLGRNEFFEESLDFLKGVKDPKSYISLAISIFPHLEGKVKLEVIAKAVQLSSNLTDDNRSVISMLSLIPYCSDNEKEGILIRVINFINDMDKVNVGLLLNVKKFVTGEEWRKMVSLALNSIDKEKSMQQAIPKYIALLPEISDDSKRKHLLDSILRNAISLPRSSFMHSLGEIAPILYEFGGEEIIRKTIHEIEVVSDWLP
jgi:uncharacterized protein YeeX (DUF496 family)